ncbi:MAG: CPBP family intramembrane glutamic endopeptidase [Candidatus Krumholzibacteriota bacterium]
MNDLNQYNGNIPQEPQQPQGLWETWSRGRIMGLATILMAGNFFFQVLFYLVRTDLFVPVLAGAVAGVLLPVYLLARRWNFTLRRDFSLTTVHPLILAAAALMALCSLVPTSLLAELSLRLHPANPQWESFFRENMPTTGPGILFAVFTVVFVAPLAEEIIFRGLLHRLASVMWGAMPAALISALVFAIVHGEPWFLFGLVGVGFMLAFIYETTRSVTACWVAHAVHNAVSLWAMLNAEGSLAEPQPITMQDWGLAAGSILGMLVVGRFLWTVGKPAT